MNESMARQFGNFCGKFIEYDTSIPTLGSQSYLRTRVCLDVTAPLKRKKKILCGKSLVVYARFKYEKLSLFCFICGRLGHGESFYPLRLQIEPSKIIFGWDLSLRATTRRRNVMDSRWLRTADGTPCNLDRWSNSNQGNLSYEGNVLGRNVRGGNGSQNINPNLRQMGSGKYNESSSYNLGPGGGDVRMVAVGARYRSMDLISNEEEDPFALVEGKKRQRIVECTREPLKTIVDHCPLLLDSEGNIRKKDDSYVKSFRFEAKWCLDNLFEALVDKWWNENAGNVLGKLEKLGDHILRWQKSSSRVEKKKRL
ncbi:hypothetical protein Gogos_005593, partial [Gossypium gossypioides]|nr:hypothetical protein [Gossypium gossypioides]